MTVEAIKLGLIEEQIEQVKGELEEEQSECDTTDSWGLGKFVGIQLALNMLDKVELRRKME